jgi:Kef-type K+ transport system membrane component KefB
MPQNAFLALLFVVVIIGLAGGFYLSVWVLSLGDNAVSEYAGGIGTIVVTFGCVAACVALMYLLAYQIDKFVRRRKRAAHADRKSFQQKERTGKRKRKKR